MVSPDSQATACPPSGRNSTYRPVQISETSSDIAARYGGEEFAIILPNTTLRQGLTVPDHIRRAVMGKELMKRSTRESLGRVTISVGVAGWRRGDTAQTLLERADSCLYAAKRGGRNASSASPIPK